MAIGCDQLSHLNEDHDLDVEERTWADRLRLYVALLDALGTIRNGARDEYAVDLALPGLPAALERGARA